MLTIAEKVADHTPNHALKGRQAWHEPRATGKQVARPKTLDLRLPASTSDLASDIMRAFNLAKSAGKELNATFTSGPV